MIKPRAVHEDVCRWAMVGQDVGEHHLFCAEGNAPSTGDPPFVWELGYSIVWGPKSCGPEMSVPQRNHEAE